VHAHCLRSKNNRIILTWRPTGRLYHHYSKTFCVVARSDILLECDIAVGEGSGRNDREEVEEELIYKDPVRNPLMADMGVPPEAPEAPVSRPQSLPVADYYNHPPPPEAFYYFNSSRTTTMESANLAAYLISKVAINMPAMNMSAMSMPAMNMSAMNMPAVKRKTSDPEDPDGFSEQDGNHNKRPRNFHTGYSFSSPSSEDRPDGNGFTATRK